MNRIISWIRQVLSKLFNKRDLVEATKKELAISDDMSKAIDTWMEMYQGRPRWLNKVHMRSLNIPAYIASELAQMATIEMDVDIQGSARADYIKKQIEPVLKNARRYVEYACAAGGLVFKPYPDVKAGTIETDFVQANKFLPVAFNSRGEITDAFFVETKIVGKTYFRRLERHIFKPGSYTVTNTAYESYSDIYLGTEVPLSTVEEWADLPPKADLGHVEQPLFAYFKMPFANTIDPMSPLGVSVYARAVDLIEDADKQYTRLLWEFEGGEMAIEASKDIFPLDEQGRPIVPAGRERLFRPNELDPSISGAGSEIIKVHSPTLRDQSFLSGLDEILKQIEDKCGLARGSLTNPQSEPRTATEIKQLRQRSYVTVTDIQMALQDALESLIYIYDAYASLYKLAPAGTCSASYTWDDSVITDSEAERVRDMDDVREGAMQLWEYRMKWYREDEATAKRMVGYKEGGKQDDDDPFGLDKNKDEREAS